MMFATLSVLAACALCASQGSTLIQTRIAMASADAVDDGSIVQLEDEIATLSNLAQSAGSNGAGSLAALTTAKKITETMLYHAGNATEHLNSTQQTHLQTVIDLLNATLFASMDVSHNEDQQELNDAAAAVAVVNEEIVSRLAPTGDIGRIQALARSLQTNITNSQDDLNRKTATKNLTWTALNTFMQQIEESPACPSLPASKTMLTLDNFFASNAYAEWYASNKATYDPKRAAFETANTALASLVDQLTSTRTSLQAEYCDWKFVLESGCTKFDADYMKKSDDFGVDKGRVQKAMQSRIDMYKAGKIIVAHIKHLLGSAVFDENFKVTDTSRYELSIPTQQPKGPCSLTPLTAPHWDPPISCPMVYQRLEYGVNGCPAGTEIPSEQDCAMAIRALGMPVDPVWRWTPAWTINDIPMGCCVREPVQKGGHHMHWNSAQSGQGRDDVAPVCFISPQADT